jgi:GT2 family glycosyltransferase
MSHMSLAVAAVVVTFNRKQLLAECLEAVLGQTVPPSRVHVIDNASTDGTPEHLAERGLLDRPEVVYERLERNMGGAGGFSRGVEAGRPGADWVWLMDDDAEPEPDCLERLLASSAAADPGTAALCSRVVGADGRLQALHRGRLDGRPAPLELEAYEQEAPELGFATFVGLLVRGDVARRLDPPKAEFFIWVDDYEYCVRLRREGRLRLIPASTIRHKDRAPTFSTRRARLFNRLLGWEYHATPYEGAWRNFFGIRNYVWMKQQHEGLSRLGFAAVVAQFVAKALMYDERPLRRIPWLVRYARDGRRGRFVNMDPGEWAARVRRGA